MKKTSFKIAILLLSGGLFTACMSSEQKKEAADAQVVIAQDNLSTVQKNANAAAEKAATAEELKTFKLESDLKIKNNEVRIAELKLKMNKPGVVPDEVYERKIDSFELKNKNLKTRMGDYERTHSDWTKFKQDFNRDLDELGTKLKNIAKENLK
jgi:multidrug efflux pump subunit AcrB